MTKKGQKQKTVLKNYQQLFKQRGEENNRELNNSPPLKTKTVKVEEKIEGFNGI